MIIDREAQRARQRKHYAKHKEKVLAKSRAYAQAHPEVIRAINARYSAKHKEAIGKRSREWIVNNLDRHAARESIRRALKLQRTPPGANEEEIQRLYAEAKAMSEKLGEPYHVDHIVPLRGKYVSGLHVHTNLQLLRGADNFRKSNKFEVN